MVLSKLRIGWWGLRPTHVVPLTYGWSTDHIWNLSFNDANIGWFVAPCE